MTFYNAFMDEIYNMGIYYDDYNYQKIYNNLLYNIYNNIIQTTRYGFTYRQVEHLHTFLTICVMTPSYVTETIDHEDSNNEIDDFVSNAIRL